MDFEDLTPEQKNRAIACQTPEELAAFAREEGVELSDEQLEGITGGTWSPHSCSDHSFHDSC